MAKQKDIFLIIILLIIIIVLAWLISNLDVIFPTPAAENLVAAIA